MRSTSHFADVDTPRLKGTGGGGSSGFSGGSSELSSNWRRRDITNNERSKNNVQSTTRIQERKANDGRSENSSNSNYDSDCDSSDSYEQGYRKVDVLQGIDFTSLATDSLLIEASNSIARKDVPTAIEFFSRASKEESKNVERLALIEANLAAISFTDFTKVTAHLGNAITILQSQRSSSSSRSNISCSSSALEVKLLANLAVVQLALNNPTGSIETNNQAMEVIAKERKEERRRQLLEEMVYQYLRHHSAQGLSSARNSPSDSRYEGATLACWLSSMGLINEWCGDLVKAREFHMNALLKWEQLNDPGFIVMSLRHLIDLNESSYSERVELYRSRLEELLKHREFVGVDEGTLFKGYQEKLRCGKKLVESITQAERKLVVRAGEKEGAVSINKEKDTFWKQAVQLQLRASICHTKKLIEETEGSENKHSTALSLALNELEKTLESLRSEKNVMLLRRLRETQFAKDAVGVLESKMRRVGVILSIAQLRVSYEALLSEGERRHRQKVVVQKAAVARRIIFQKGYRHVMRGEYLMKCHLKSNSRRKKYFLLAGDSTLRWTLDERDINKRDKIHFYCMEIVRGVLYGKCSAVLEKQCNKLLESWRCFSLVLQSRTLDFYCESETVNHWVFVLSEETRQRNPDSFTIQPSQMLWRKMKLILYYHFVEPFFALNPDRRTSHSFVKAIIAFGRNGCRLPQRK